MRLFMCATLESGPFGSKKEELIRRRNMSSTMPIKNRSQLKKFTGYYSNVKVNSRNHALLVTGLNTALRISDILSLKWEDVYSFENDKFLRHMIIREKKTGKINIIPINSELKEELRSFGGSVGISRGKYLFQSRKGYNCPISRSQAFRIVKEAAGYAGCDDNISCHSLRKTFGYMAWNMGASVTVLMEIFNHSSYDVTRRYLGIGQYEKDEIYMNMEKFI